MTGRRIIPVLLAVMSLGACAQLNTSGAPMEPSTYQESQVGSGSGWLVTGGIDTPTTARRVSSEQTNAPATSSGGASTGAGR